ncbi:hypothetical protein D3C75_1079600 [compost metagenome]
MLGRFGNRLLHQGDQINHPHVVVNLYTNREDCINEILLTVLPINARAKHDIRLSRILEQPHGSECQQQHMQSGIGAIADLHQLAGMGGVQ